jgi:hypothetical protein
VLWSRVTAQGIDGRELNNAAPGAGCTRQRESIMWALIAIGMCVGLFALFNLIEFKRLD